MTWKGHFFFSNHAMFFSDFITNRTSRPNEFAPLDLLDFFLWISLDLRINS